MPNTYSAPDTGNFAYDLARAELNIRGGVYSAISNIKHNQKLEEGWIEGAKAVQLKRTRGILKPGEGEVEFSDFEEAVLMIENLGDGWGEIIFPIVCIWTAPNKRPIKEELLACRFLDVTLDHKAGAEGQPATFPFSFMERKINGKRMIIK